MARTAVILTALGGPSSLDDIDRFMASYLGRPAPLPVVSALRERYALIGGKSPLVDIVKAQALALAAELGRDFGCFAGFRHSAPSIAAAFEAAQNSGAERFVFLALSPFETVFTTGSYKKAVDALGIAGERAAFVGSFHDNPHFVAAWRESVTAHPGITGDKTGVIFTAHSLPIRYIETGDPYKTQIEAVVAQVASDAELRVWRTGWQSRPARASEPWIGPEVEQVIDALAEEGVRHIVEVPIGFTCDHLETLYDIDIVHKGHAETRGLEFSRVASLNTNPLFIRALADIVRNRAASL